MEWISVKDRLPDRDGEYLCVSLDVFFGKKFIEVHNFTKNLYKVDKYDFKDEKGKSGFYGYDREYGYFQIGNVTHWMPLPKLPKGE